jgi:hypothetical protein
MGFEVKRCKKKRGTYGLGKPHVPSYSRRRGKDLVIKPNLLPPRRRKVINSFYKINIKKVLT